MQLILVLLNYSCLVKVNVPNSTAAEFLLLLLLYHTVKTESQTVALPFKVTLDIFNVCLWYRWLSCPCPSQYLSFWELFEKFIKSRWVPA